jgi:hypothetical protein
VLFDTSDVEDVEEIWQQEMVNGRTQAAVIVCLAPRPSVWYAADAWPDAFTVALSPIVPILRASRVDDRKWIALEVCYKQVDLASYVVACTQPWYGWQRGVCNKQFEGPPGTCHNYFDEYINHHRNVGYGHIHVYAQSDFTVPLQRYIDEGYVTLT